MMCLKIPFKIRRGEMMVVRCNGWCLWSYNTPRLSVYVPGKDCQSVEEVAITVVAVCRDGCLEGGWRGSCWSEVRMGRGRANEDLDYPWEGCGEGGRAGDSWHLWCSVVFLSQLFLCCKFFHLAQLCGPEEGLTLTELCSLLSSPA